MNKTTEYFVKKNESGKRLDVFLANEIKDLTRSQIKKLIEESKVKLNKSVCLLPSTKTKENDKIIVNITTKQNKKIKPNKIKLNIIYEDKDILIVNKPKGMVVHPGAGNYENTLVNALMYKYKNKLSDVNGNSRLGIVHRIDKETSGLLVVAKNNSSHLYLAKQFSNHSIKRRYQCLVWGVVRPLNGRIETLISRSRKNRQLMAVSEIRGKKAITNYKTIKVFNIKDVPRISLLECVLETGRTHQIRVHLKYKGASLLGDKQYGKGETNYKKINKEFFNHLKKLSGQALHAMTLEFNHPTKKKNVTFKSSLPGDFQKMLNLLDNLSA